MSGGCKGDEVMMIAISEKWTGYDRNGRDGAE